MYGVIEVEWYDFESISGLTCKRVFTDKGEAEDYVETLKGLEGRFGETNSFYVVYIPIL